MNNPSLHSRPLAPFLVIWTGQALSLLGSQLVQFALVWWLTESTGSGTVLAFATTMALVPQIVLGPFAGALVDRWNRRAVMIGADAIIALATLGLAYLFLAGSGRVWHVYLIMLVRSAAGTFHWPAMAASTTLMVPERHLSRVGGMNEALQGAMSIVAPPLGALLLAILPLSGILVIDVGTAVVAIAPLLFIAVPQPPLAETSRPATVWQDVLSGMNYLRGWPGLMGVLLVVTLLNIFISPAFSLLPLVVTGRFGGDALQLGWLSSAWGAGLVIGGVVLSAWGGFRRRMATTMAGLIGVGLGFLAVGVAPASAFVMALGGLLVAGIMHSIAAGSLFATLQATVPPAMQGRLFTILTSSMALMAPLGLAVAGPLSDRLGGQIWFLVGGAFIIVAASVVLSVPALMTVEEQNQGTALEEPEAPMPIPGPLT